MANKPEKFDVTWEAEDGYVGGSRPQHFKISADEFEPDYSETALRELFEELLQDDFKDTVRPATEDEDRFVQWAQEQQAKMKEDRNA